MEATKPKQHFKGPSKSPSINHGAKIQCVEDDNSAPPTQEQTKFVQRVIGKFLFIAEEVDDTLLHALNNLAYQVSKSIPQQTWEATQHVLKCTACNPTPEIRCRASDMILEAESDAAFDVIPDARSRAAGHIFLGSSDNTQFNASVHVLSKTIKGVMGSAAEAEVVAIHMNAHELIPIKDCLNTLKHPQPPTGIKTDNITAKGFAQGAVKQKRSKGCDCECWWLKDRVKEFNVTLAPGKTNLADCHSKHHSGADHSKVRPIHLCEEKKSPTDLQGCVKLLTNAHHSGQARKQATSPPSQARISDIESRDFTPHVTGGGIDDRCSATHQYPTLGMHPWLESASTTPWHRLNNSKIN